MAGKGIFSLFDTVQSHLSDFEGDLHTGVPAIVERYDAKEATVDAFPAIYKKDKADGLLIKEILLERVPVVFTATQELGITYPLKKGDVVWLMFSHRDSENWLVSDKEYESPKTNRKHDINDAFAIAGVFKYKKSPVPQGQEDNLCIRYKDNDIAITPDGELIINSINTITINAPNQDINIDAANLNITGNLHADGEVSDGIGELSNLRDNYNAHTHLGYAATQTTTTDKPDP